MYRIEPYAPVQGKDHSAYDYDDESRRSHPAVVPSSELRGAAIRIVFALIIISFMASLVGGCAMTEHRDGKGYTVRYDLNEPVQMAEPKKFNRKPAARATAKPAPAVEPAVVIVEQPKDSHPVLNIGRDDEIPREYAKYVSDRSIRTWPSRSRMCNQARPGYCNSPNVPHCHGPFCHAHPDGGRRHTH